MEGTTSVIPERIRALPESDRFIDAFVRLWAFASIIHLTVQSHGRLDSPWSIATVLTAFVVLVQPRSMGWFAVMAVAQIADMVHELPESPDHWMVIAVANLAILATFAVRRQLGTAALATAFPAVRAIVLVAYVAAATAKWNSSFLDTAVSCAPAIADQASLGLTDGLGLDPLFVYSVLATEASIPILLLFRRTRRHGV